MKMTQQTPTFMDSRIIQNSNFNWSMEYNFSSLPRLKQVTKETGRYYCVEGDSSLEDMKFYSVTTILGDDPEKRKALNEWKKRVGNEEANRISKFAAGRGTRLHDLMEKYIRGYAINLDEVFPHVIEMFLSGIDVLEQKITKVYGLEERLFSKQLRMAGTVDGLVEWEGVPSILDFKTSRKLKKKEWIQDYFLQTTAYSIMWEELTGKKIDQLVVYILVDGESEPQIFKETTENYKPLLLRRLYEFYQRRGEDPPPIFLS